MTQNIKKYMNSIFDKINSKFNRFEVTSDLPISKIAEQLILG